MPCNTVRTSKVAWQKVDLERLSRVLTSQGWDVLTTAGRDLALQGATSLVASKGGVTCQWTKGAVDVKVRGNPAAGARELEALKRPYAAATVTDGARKFGWRVQATEVAADKTTIKLAR